MNATIALSQQFRRGLARLFSVFQAPDAATSNALACSLLVQDATTLLSGTYGSGKTLFVQLARHTFFAPNGDGIPDFGWVACTQDLTPMDTLFSIDLARLTQGEEVVHPRAIVTARLKFVNEVQRASSLVYNALLPLFSERKVSFRDRDFTSPPFLAFLDANPHDAGSSEMPAAFLDRIDFSIRIPLVSAEGLSRVIASATETGPARWNDLAGLAQPALRGPEMEALWHDVRGVRIGEEVRMIAVLVAAHLQRCVRTDRSLAGPDFDLRCNECSYRTNACSKLASVPGTRFVISALKMAQARAWLRGAREAEVDDFLYALPHVLAHRLQLRPDVVRLYSGPAEWVIEELYRAGVRQHVPRWRQVIHRIESTEPSDRERLADLAHRDLAVDHLFRRRLAPPEQSNAGQAS